MAHIREELRLVLARQGASRSWKSLSAGLHRPTIRAGRNRFRSITQKFFFLRISRVFWPVIGSTRVRSAARTRSSLTPCSRAALARSDLRLSGPRALPWRRSARRPRPSIFGRAVCRARRARSSAAVVESCRPARDRPKAEPGATCNHLRDRHYAARWWGGGLAALSAAARHIDASLAIVGAQRWPDAGRTSTETFHGHRRGRRTKRCESSL